MKLALALLICLAGAILPGAARAQDAWYPLTADDGRSVTNHRVPVELSSEIDGLPGIVVVGNPHGDVTLDEFYDLNCPFCRKAAPDLAAMVASDPELRLVLVPFPVLSAASVQAARVELALAARATPQQFYAFHHALYAGRGVVDGTRALTEAAALGFDPGTLTTAANQNGIVDVMKAHLRLGNELGLSATPSFVIKGVAILGYPGPKALAAVVQSVRRCDRVTC